MQFTKTLIIGAALAVSGCGNSSQLTQVPQPPQPRQATPPNYDPNAGDPTLWQSVNGGAFHTVALNTQGEAWVWGDNTWGQLGTGDLAAIETPTRLNSLGDVIHIEASQHFTAALLADGTVWTWGRNKWMQLGYGTNGLDQLQPKMVTDLPPIQEISTGGKHMVALAEDGTVWTWGHNTWGQLGHGHTDSLHYPTPIQDFPSVTAIFGGELTTFALDESGKLWGWGRNYSGQVGIGGRSQEVMVPTAVDIYERVIKVAPGAEHTLAFTEQGHVFAWGSNTDGQLGPFEDYYTPVPRMLLGFIGVTDIAAGYHHSMVLNEDGSISSWGANYWGQLGDGTTIATHSDSSAAVSPTAVRLPRKAIAINTGGYNGFALLDDGAIVSWGTNSYDQLGEGTRSHVERTPLAISSLSQIAQVAAGQFTSFALTESGDVFSWGENARGQLGSGDRQHALIPRKIPGLSDVAELFTGPHTGFALTNVGDVFAWGYSNTGQTGAGSGADLSNPTLIPDLTEVIKIAPGMHHTLALRSDGQLLSWGSNWVGQLGDGTTMSNEVPTPVPGLNHVLDIAAGRDHSLALLDDGRVMAWGQCRYGQTANGNAKGIDDCWDLYPTVVEGVTNVVAVAAGRHHSVAILADGTAMAWGACDFGRLGIAGLQEGDCYLETPMQVQGVENAVSAITGRYSTYFIIQDAGGLSVMGTGGNFSGELGPTNLDIQVNTPVPMPHLDGARQVASGWYHLLAIDDATNVQAWGLNKMGQLGQGTALFQPRPSIPLQAVP